MTTRVEPHNVSTALGIIDSLEPGEHRFINDVAWEEYEQLLEELGDSCKVRISYDEGTLELMGPTYRHEKYKEFILRAAAILTRSLGLKLESAGSVTLKREKLSRGAEPDTCFYIQHASHVIGKETIDLEIDPPPDIVVEIDITRPSHTKRDIYARLGVPEFWCYDGTRFRIFRLVGMSYVECDLSPTFPFLNALDMQDFIELSKTEGQDAALDKLQEWVITRKQSS